MWKSVKTVDVAAAPSRFKKSADQKWIGSPEIASGSFSSLQTVFGWAKGNNRHCGISAVLLSVSVAVSPSGLLVWLKHESCLNYRVDFSFLPTVKKTLLVFYCFFFFFTVALRVGKRWELFWSSLCRRCGMLFFWLPALNDWLMMEEKDTEDERDVKKIKVHTQW